MLETNIESSISKKNKNVFVSYKIDNQIDKISKKTIKMFNKLGQKAVHIDDKNTALF